MKTGDKVIVPAEINGYGRECPEAYGRKGGVYHDFQLITE